MMKYALIVFLAVAALGVYVVMFMIATVKHDPNVWHVDPLEAPHCVSPNCFRMAPEGATDQAIDAVAPVYGETGIVMAEAFHDFALAQRDTQSVFGVAASQHMTYVQRTEMLRVPDYISVKFIDLPEGGSTVAIFSRSRFGYGDMGVNEARVRRWVDALKPFEVAPVGQ